MKLNTLTLAVLLAGTASVASADSITVDLFTDPAAGQTASTETIGAFDSNQAGVFASILGGSRDISVTKLTDTFGLPTSGAAAVSVGAGSLTIDNATGVTSRSVITWDGANVAGNDGASVLSTGLGGVDLTLNGAINTFLADVQYADLGFNYKIRLWDMDGSMATLTAGVQFPVDPLLNYVAPYAFDWFNLANGNYCAGGPAIPCDPFTQLSFNIARGGNMGDIDFTKIGAMQMVFDNVGVMSADFALGKVRAQVPEPSTLALLGLGLLGLGVTARRKLAA